MLRIRMISSTPLITNKSPSVPSTPAPVTTTAAATEDTSAEVAKQRAIEEERAKREKGLSATDNTGGTGVALDQENVSKSTLLGSSDATSL